LCYLVGSVVPGAGAFEIAAHAELTKCKDTIKGRSRLGYLLLLLTFLSGRIEANEILCVWHGLN